MEVKTMYHIEKFLPPECPKCRHPFKNENTDWVRLLGDIVNGEKQVRQTNGYGIIVCSKCDNYTAQVQLEMYQLASKEQAQELCDKEGFVNLQKVRATGDHTKDMHMVVRSGPSVGSVVQLKSKLT